MYSVLNMSPFIEIHPIHGDGEPRTTPFPIFPFFFFFYFFFFFLLLLSDRTIVSSDTKPTYGGRNRAIIQADGPKQKKIVQIDGPSKDFD